MPRGIPGRVGHRAAWDTVPRGIPCRAGYRAAVGYRAAWDTVPRGIPCRVGHRAAWDTVLSGYMDAGAADGRAFQVAVGGGHSDAQSDQGLDAAACRRLPRPGNRACCMARASCCVPHAARRTSSTAAAHVCASLSRVLLSAPFSVRPRSSHARRCSRPRRARARASAAVRTGALCGIALNCVAFHTQWSAR